MRGVLTWCENWFMGIFLMAAMIAAGVILAAAVLLTAAVAAKGRAGEFPAAADPRESREAIVASILWQIARLSGSDDGRLAGIIASERLPLSGVQRDIDIGSWAAAFAGRFGRDEAWALLERAVRVARGTGSPLPLPQYSALLDLSFSLGFQTDALARLRAQYGFDYVDHAKNARPQSAGGSGAAAPFFQRQPADQLDNLRILGLHQEVPRQVLISTYRKLAAHYHPDRHHGSGGEAEAAAARRFIEITRAYEELLGRDRRD